MGSSHFIFILRRISSFSLEVLYHSLSFSLTFFFFFFFNSIKKAIEQE